MEELDKLPKEYIESFNYGYAFSKNFPEVAQSITEQNKPSENELSPLAGMINGLEEGLKQGRDLVDERLSELKEIENLKDVNRDHGIDR